MPSNNRDLWEICLASGDGDVMLLSGRACEVSLCARVGCWKVGMGGKLVYMLTPIYMFCIVGGAYSTREVYVSFSAVCRFVLCQCGFVAG